MNAPEQGVLNAILRQDFRSFLARALRELAPEEEYLPNWHHEAIAWRLEQIVRGDVTRCIVTLPPRNLKSIMISVAWVAWKLGHQPGLRLMCISYNAELAAKFARDCRQVMQSAWYRGAFPGTVLARSAEMDLETTSGGGRFSTSIGGTLTGRGADIIIIDDPLKADDAMSEAARSAVNDWVQRSLISRLNDKRKGRIIVVMQRLHEDDLAGRLLGVGGWDHLNLPAIAEIDEAVAIGEGREHLRNVGSVLHVEREPLETLMAVKAAMGSFAFAAQYQQAPVPSEGNMVRPEWLGRYAIAPVRQPRDKIVQSWDTASKEGVLNDHSACVTALFRKDEIWIVDVFRQKLGFPDLLRQVEIQALRHGADTILIEDAASGQQLIQMLQAAANRSIPRPCACRPEKDKITRFAAATPMIEQRRLILPAEAHWLAEFERELFAFPHGRHDDQVDALSQLLAWAAGRPRVRAVIPWIGDPTEQGWR